MTGYTTNSRGRYKCDYCTHSTYKTIGGIENHLDTMHRPDWTADKLRAEIERLKNRPPKVVEKERIVYRDPPAKKEVERWNASVYCSTCKIVMSNTGIPRGQTIEETPHSDCGTRGLMLVVRIV